MPKIKPRPEIPPAGTPAAVSLQPSARLAGLELLRFVAALAVLLAHYHHFYMHGESLPADFAISRQPLYGLAHFLYDYGTRAVEVFWCLSGFVFFHRYADELTTRSLSLLKFFWLRFSRLYPLHLATLLLVALLEAAYHRQNGVYFIQQLYDLKHFLLNLSFVQYWGFQDGFSFNAPAWSVSVELVAYFFFYAMTYWLGGDLVVVLGCLAGCWVLTYARGTEYVIVRCIGYFYLGGLACVLYRQAAQRLRFPNAYLLLLPCAILLSFAVWRFQHGGNLDWILNLFVPALLPALALASPLLPAAVARLCATLGNLTYASYLLHYPLQILVLLLLGALHVPPTYAASPWTLLAFILATFTAAHATYRHFELPAQQQIRRTLGPASIRP